MEEDVRTTAMLIKNQIACCNRDRANHQKQEQQKLTTSSSSNNLTTNIEQGLQAIFANPTNGCSSVASTMSAAANPSSPPVAAHASAPDFTAAINAVAQQQLSQTPSSVASSVASTASARPLSPPAPQAAIPPTASSASSTVSNSSTAPAARAPSPPVQTNNIASTTQVSSQQNPGASAPVSTNSIQSNCTRPATPPQQQQPTCTATSEPHVEPTKPNVILPPSPAVQPVAAALTPVPATLSPPPLSETTTPSPVVTNLLVQTAETIVTNNVVTPVSSQQSSSSSSSASTTPLTNGFALPQPSLSATSNQNSTSGESTPVASPQIQTTILSVESAPSTVSVNDSSDVKPNLKSRFSIIPIEEDAVLGAHSSPSGSGSNSNTNSNCNTISSSSSMLSKNSAEEGQPLSLVRNCIGDDHFQLSLTPQCVEEETSSLSGNSTPSGLSKGRFKVTTIVDSVGDVPGMPSRFDKYCLLLIGFLLLDPVAQITRANGISDSNAKALEAAVTKIMTDYWAQHSLQQQALNCNGYRGSDPDIFSSR